MYWKWIIGFSDFFNNAPVAAFVAIFTGAFFGNKIYAQQKRLDREEKLKTELIDFITSLQYKCSYILFLINRINFSTQLLQKQGIETKKEDLKPEFDRLSAVVNEDLPNFLMKIEPKLNQYFLPESSVIKKYLDFHNNLKEWHQPIVEVKFSFHQRTKDQPSLSLEKVNEAAKQ